MKKLYLVIILFLICRICGGQNLVPNPSFEDTLPHDGFCQIPLEYATYWFNPTAGTPDLFTYSPGSTNCTTSSLNNGNGYQLPKTGINYAGFYTYPGREYAAIRLDSNLSNGCKYYVEFFVSRADGYALASDNISCAFTNDTSGYYMTLSALPLLPAIQSQPGVLITDTLNWVMISGDYIANGTEQFLLIGNFSSNANTYSDTVSPSLYYSAYYYLDDVMLLTCDSTAAINNINPNNELVLSPNPFTDNLTITLTKNQPLEITLYDITSRKVFNQRITNTTSLNTSHLAKGIYIYEGRDDKGIVMKGKLVKE